jgi:hypothetical protein
MLDLFYQAKGKPEERKGKMKHLLKEIGQAPKENCPECGRLTDYLRESKTLGISKRCADPCYWSAVFNRPMTVRG